MIRSAADCVRRVRCDLVQVQGKQCKAVEPLRVITLDGLKDKLINRHMPVAVMEEKVDWKEVKVALHPCVAGISAGQSVRVCRGNHF